MATQGSGHGTPARHCARIAKNLHAPAGSFRVGRSRLPSGPSPKRSFVTTAKLIRSALLAAAGRRRSAAAIAFCCCVIALAPPAAAAIVTSGNLTGDGPPYNGVDDPWVTSLLRVGDTAPGGMTITDGSDVSNAIDGFIAVQSSRFDELGDRRWRWIDVDQFSRFLTSAVPEPGRSTSPAAAASRIQWPTLAASPAATARRRSAAARATPPGPTPTSDVGDSGTGVLNITGGGSVSSFARAISVWQWHGHGRWHGSSVGSGTVQLRGQSQLCR